MDQYGFGLPRVTCVQRTTILLGKGEDGRKKEEEVIIHEKRLSHCTRIFHHLQVRDYRSEWELQVNQPVAGNYYPVGLWFYICIVLFQINLGIYMQDDSAEFSVLVDRSVGGSSILDGQIELMLHR
ncbi:hypothetical protein B296_00004957 [Ensete ventricosum]|uniref:Glycosyl hydrolase family 38 C-terminal domain-containing protein n=1 Tax=Ensete ventricosum TaxID=4639 RepID=A0A427B6A8_ENSVE|nr:hypothetical protein B296_00004957 [Ensete ventricosum]